MQSPLDACCAGFCAAIEVFYRFHVTPQLHISPDVQLVIHPSKEPDREVVGVFGLRARLLF